jgi:hypothetical protein
VVVSEERGQVSVAIKGRMIHAEDEKRLSGLVRESLTVQDPADRNWKERIRSMVLNRWRTKLVTLSLVAAFWLVLAGQQDFETTLRVPLEVTGLPAGMEIVEPRSATILITLRGLRRDASILDEENVHARLDLSGARPGRMDFAVTRNEIDLPHDRVQLVRVEPSRILFVFRRNKERLRQ